MHRLPNMCKPVHQSISRKGFNPGAVPMQTQAERRRSVKCVAHLTNKLAAAVCLVHIVDSLEQANEVLPAESLRISAKILPIARRGRLSELSRHICHCVPLSRRAWGTSSSTRAVQRHPSDPFRAGGRGALERLFLG